MNMSYFYSQVTNNFEELDVQDCIDSHGVDFISDRGTLILITKDLTVHNESLRWVDIGNLGYRYTTKPFMWMCEDLKRPDRENPDYTSCMQGHRKNLAVASTPWSPPLFRATTLSTALLINLILTLTTMNAMTRKLSGI